MPIDRKAEISTFGTQLPSWHSWIKEESFVEWQEFVQNPFPDPSNSWPLQEIIREDRSCAAEMQPTLSQEREPSLVCMHEHRKSGFGLKHGPSFAKSGCYLLDQGWGWTTIFGIGNETTYFTHDRW